MMRTKMSKKNDILTTATRLFNQHSFVSVGIDRIIDESQVAKMTFYKHFNSKEKLIIECLLAKDNEIREQLTHAIQETQKLNGNKVDGILKWYENWLYSADFYGSLFVKAINQYIRDIAFKHSKHLKKLFQLALNSQEKSDYLFALLAGATVREQVYKDKTSLSLIKQTVKMIA